MVARFLRAELSGEPLGAEERRHTHHSDPLSLGVLSSIQLCIGGCQSSPPHKLGVTAEVTGEAAVYGFDGFGIPVEEIIGHTELIGGSGIGAIKAKRPFKPRQGLCGSARPYQGGAARRETFGIARIDLKGMLCLSQGEIETSPGQMYLGEQAVGDRGRGV